MAGDTPDPGAAHEETQLSTTISKPASEAFKDLMVWIGYAAFVPLLPAIIAPIIKVVRPQTPDFMQTLSHGDLFFAGVVLIFAGMAELGRARIRLNRAQQMVQLVVVTIAILNAVMSVILTPDPTGTGSGASAANNAQPPPGSVADTSLILYIISAGVSALCFFIATLKHYSRDDHASKGGSQ